MMLQQTIKDIIRFSGVGLHTGSNVNVSVCPAAENTGIVFKRVDLPDAPLIKADVSNVVATNYATSIGVNGATVSTIEHLMAAFYGLGVDNAIVEIDGGEVPAMDGSASHFIEMVEAAGLRSETALRKYIVIKKPIKAGTSDRFVMILPSEDVGLTIDYSIDFSHPSISKQYFARVFSKDVFRREVGKARTFGFLRDIEMLKANGLARGGSLNNAIVIGDASVLNEGGLRYPDEFVRHKVLDMMGDISLIGYQVIGKVIAHRSGHALNCALVREILEETGKWSMTDTPFDDAADYMAMDSMATV